MVYKYLSGRATASATCFIRHIGISSQTTEHSWSTLSITERNLGAYSNKWSINQESRIVYCHWHSHALTQVLLNLIYLIMLWSDMNNKFYLKVNILLLNRFNSMILSTCCSIWSDFMEQQFKDEWNIVTKEKNY